MEFTLHNTTSRKLKSLFLFLKIKYAVKKRFFWMLNHFQCPSTGQFHPLGDVCHLQPKFKSSVKFHLFFLGVGGMGSSAIYSCKFNVSQSDGTLWLHVFASHLRASSTLRSGTHTVKWDQQCENIKDESHNSNKKPPVKKERKKKHFCMLAHFYPRTGKVGHASL